MSKQVKLATGVISGTKVLLENSDESRELYNQARYGEQVGDSFQISFLEALYLLEKKKLIVLNGKNKEINFETFYKRARRGNTKFTTRYAVYSDLRTRGYIVKTALKFGAEFRVYDRGVKPGEDHARWVVFPVYEAEVLTWYEFAAKNRVAHSTKKRLMLGIVDDESSVTYYEVRWLRP